MDVGKEKKEIFGKIAALRVSTENYPRNLLTNSIESISKKTNSLNFLIDLHKSLVGFNSLKESLIQIITYNLDEIELDVKQTIKNSLKSMVSCGTNPTIPQSFIDRGIDLELNKIDLLGTFKVNPTSDEGSLLYDDVDNYLNSVDFNTFLYNAIQNGTTTEWGESTTNEKILKVKFNENGVSSTSQNNTINIKPSDLYSNESNGKKLPDFNNDYIDSIKLFNSAKLINSVMDSVFGVITSKTKKTAEEIKRDIKINEIIDRVINSNDDEIIDDSFFTFSNDELNDINYKSKLKQSGKSIITTNNEVDSTISFDRLNKLDKELSENSLMLNKNDEDMLKIATLVSGGLDDLATESVQNINLGDQLNGKINFIEKILRVIMTNMVNTLLSPKMLIILSINHKIVHGKTFDDVEAFIKLNKTLITSVTKTIRNSVINILMDKILKEVKNLAINNFAKTQAERINSKKAQISSLIGVKNDLINQVSGSMNGIINKILTTFNIPKKPVSSLPPQLLLIGAKLRPGLSARDVTSRIISRQSEAGAPVGDIFSKSPNVMESMTSIIIDEVVKSIQLDAKIEVVIPPGVQVTTTGLGNMGAPIISQGATTNIGFGEGVIR